MDTSSFSAHDFAFYVFLLAAVVAAVFIVKKITGCLVRSVLIILVAGVLAYVYLRFFSPSAAG